MAPPHRFRAAILDVDGTLVDSNDQHAHAWVDVLVEHGFPAIYTATRRLIGKGGDKLLAELTGLAEDDPRSKRIGERRGEIFAARYLPTVRAFAGTRDLVSRLRAAKLAIAVASSAKRDELGPLLELAGISDLLDAATSSSDAPRSKPEPDIVTAALRRLGVDPTDAVMIGDTPYDIEAAHAAGLGTIALRCGGWSTALLRDAIAIYDGPAQLCEQLDASPLGR